MTGAGNSTKASEVSGSFCSLCPLKIPCHKGTKLGALARRQGFERGVAVPNVHTRTGSKT